MPTSALRAYRTKHGITPEALAATLGISVSTLRSLENGTRRFTAEMAKKCEEELGIERAVFRPDLYRYTKKIEISSGKLP